MSKTATVNSLLEEWQVKEDTKIQIASEILLKWREYVRKRGRAKITERPQKSEYQNMVGGPGK